MTTAAAWVVAASLWAGALLPGSWWLAVVGALSLLAVRLTRSRSRPPAQRRPVGSPPAPAIAPRRWRVLAGMAVAMALVGSGLAGGRVALRDGGALPDLAARGGQARMRATVVTEARPTEPAPWQEAASDPGWLLVRVTRLDGRRLRERALVRVGSVEDAPALGEQLRLTASARPLDTGGFGGYVRRRHAAVALNVEHSDVVGQPGPVLAATNRARRRTRQAYGRHLDDERAGLLAGLVVGERRGRSAEREGQFAAAGLSHLVVVSGRHVALMLAGVLGTCLVARVGAQTRRWIGLTALFWFAVLVRWQPSVLRASTMGGLVLGAGLLGRGTEPRHHLAVAVTLLLLVDPMLAGQVGFALSVLATAGVLVLTPWFAQRLPGPRPARLLIAVTAGAQVGAAPVLLGAFQRIALASVPANLVAVPAAALAQTVGMAAAVVSQLSVVAGGMAAAAAAPMLSVILWAAEAFSGGPMLRPADLRSPLVLVALATLALARYAPRTAAAVAALAVAVALVPLATGPGAVTTPRLTAFDVGQGDALLVEIPGEPPARLLYDGGPDPGTALAHLRAHGVSRLDVVVISHPHRDHVTGLPAVLEQLPVGVLLRAPHDADEYDEELVAPARRLPQTARRAGVPVRAVAAGDRFHLGDATVEVLSPPAHDTLGGDPNENSLVLRVHTRAGRILLTGDAESEAQRRLLDDPPRLRADVVQVPHHGGATNADGFLDAVQADVAVISVGSDNEHGHPHPDVLAALAGTVVSRTDDHGTVTVALPPTRADLHVGPRAGPSAPTRVPHRILGHEVGRVRAVPTGSSPLGKVTFRRGSSPCVTPSFVPSSSVSPSCSVSRPARTRAARRPRPRSVWRTRPTRPPARAPPPSPWRSAPKWAAATTRGPVRTAAR